MIWHKWAVLRVSCTTDRVCTPEADLGYVCAAFEMRMQRLNTESSSFQVAEFIIKILLELLPVIQQKNDCPVSKLYRYVF